MATLIDASSPPKETLTEKVRIGTATLLRQARDRMDRQLLEVSLSPIDKYVVLKSLLKDSALYDPSYAESNNRKITKILSIYGVEWFKGRSVLELGAGHCDIGAFFADLGARVVCVEGRRANLNVGRLKYRNLGRMSFIERDLDADFSDLGTFDIIINLGLLYHLDDVARHLRTCLAMSDEMILETVVCDSRDPDTVLRRPENPFNQEEAMNGTGSRPSPFFVERVAEEAGFAVQRYFDADLNVGRQYRYDWSHRDNDAPNDDFVNRRFWRLVKLGASGVKTPDRLRA